MFILLGILVYIAVAGLLQPIFAGYLAALCSNCSTGAPYALKTNNYGGTKMGEPGIGHGGDSGWAAAFWFLFAPYVLANMLVNDKYKAGRKAIKSYHENKAMVANKQRLRAMEIEAGIN